MASEGAERARLRPRGGPALGEPDPAAEERPPLRPPSPAARGPGSRCEGLPLPSGATGGRAAAAMERTPIPVLTVPTAPYEDQRPTGGGGLRRPTALFESQRNYLPNFVQSLLSSVDLRDRQGCTMVVGSDGRYFSKTAIEIVVQMAAANGVSGAPRPPLRGGLPADGRGRRPPGGERGAAPEGPGRTSSWHKAGRKALQIKMRGTSRPAVCTAGGRLSPVPGRTSFGL